MMIVQSAVADYFTSYYLFYLLAIGALKCFFQTKDIYFQTVTSLLEILLYHP